MNPRKRFWFRIIILAAQGSPLVFSAPRPRLAGFPLQQLLAKIITKLSLYCGHPPSFHDETWPNLDPPSQGPSRGRLNSILKYHL
jgi:hypothetical protein